MLPANQMMTRPFGFSPDELRSALESLGVPYDEASSPTTFESIIHHHQWLYWFLRLHYSVAAIGSNLIYLYFAITTGNDGVNVIVGLFDRTQTVPPWLGYGLGTLLATTEVTYYILLVCPQHEAVQSSVDLLGPFYTLDLPYAVMCQLKERAQQLVKERVRLWTSDPLTGGIQGLEMLFHQTVLLSFNATWVAASLVLLPPSLAKAMAPFILFYGVEYCRIYSNADYYRGVEFWKQRGLHQFLQRFQEDPLIGMQILLQTASSIGLKAFPICFFISKQAQITLGWWPAPYFIVAMTI